MNSEIIIGYMNKSDIVKKIVGGYICELESIIISNEKILANKEYCSRLRDESLEHMRNEIDECKKQIKMLRESQEQPSPSIEKMAEERYSNSLVGLFQKFAFIQGYKANNHLDELEKLITEEQESAIKFGGEAEYLNGLQYALTRIQELKTKQ